MQQLHGSEEWQYNQVTIRNETEKDTNFDVFLMAVVELYVLRGELKRIKTGAERGSW
jgi:hypothetical protein